MYFPLTLHSHRMLLMSLSKNKNIYVLTVHNSDSFFHKAILNGEGEEKQAAFPGKEQFSATRLTLVSISRLLTKPIVISYSYFMLLSKQLSQKF